MDPHVKYGGGIARSAAEASAKANFSIAMLPNGDAVKQAVLGPGGVVEKLPTDGLFVDMSTRHRLNREPIFLDRLI